MESPETACSRKNSAFSFFLKRKEKLCTLATHMPCDAVIVSKNETWRGG
jgi:hypothetical protein